MVRKQASGKLQDGFGKADVKLKITNYVTMYRGTNCELDACKNWSNIILYFIEQFKFQFFLQPTAYSLQPTAYPEGTPTGQPTT
jgi:hypothetical protein